MRPITKLASLGVSFAIVGAIASCDDGPGGDELTTVTGPNASSSSGMGAMGGGGSSDGGTTTTGGNGGTTTTGGNGGSGGEPEAMINGCLSTLTTDMTGMASINIDITGGPYCVTVSKDTTMTFTLDQGAGACPGLCDHRPLGGAYDDATQIKYPDPGSPIVSCCDASPFQCCPAVTSSPFLFNGTGVFPWYDDKHPMTERGVVYVVP
jgi:hypothetical protein